MMRTADRAVVLVVVALAATSGCSVAETDTASVTANAGSGSTGPTNGGGSGVTAEGAGSGTAADAVPELLGGCILMSPIGEVPADVYEMTDVTPTDLYPPFTKELTSHGLKLVARDDVSDDFMRLVGRTIAESFPRDEGLDLEAQREILANHYRYNALIPVPVGDDMSFIEDDEEAFNALTRGNTVCDIIMQDVPRGQVMEVVEHILHYVSDVGLHYTFPDEWGITETSALARAMQKSIDEGYYNVEQYDDIRGEEHHRVLMQEFAYWVISTAWDLQQDYGPDENEWTIVDRADLQDKLPEFYEVYERTVGRTMVPPTPETLQAIGPTRAEERR